MLLALAALICAQLRHPQGQYSALTCSMPCPRVALLGSARPSHCSLCLCLPPGRALSLTLPGFVRWPACGLPPQILLYEIIAGVILAGLWATVSLLLRHWKAIEQPAAKQVGGLWHSLPSLAYKHLLWPAVGGARALTGSVSNWRSLGAVEPDVRWLQ